MARRRKRSDLAVSLFPFLSVLSCVIGTLTLMIAAAAIGEVAQDLEDEPAESISDTPLLTPEDLEAFAGQVDAAERLREELETARSELRALGLRPEDPAQQRKRAVQDRVRLARLRTRMGELERTQIDLHESLEVVRSESTHRARQADSAPITIQPRGGGTGLVPFFVECAAEGVRVHSQGAERSVLLHIQDFAEASRFQAFLRRVRVTLNGVVILLIRPDGVATYHEALQQVEKLNVRNGKLALPGHGRLDFSLF